MQQQNQNDQQQQQLERERLSRTVEQLEREKSQMANEMEKLKSVITNSTFQLTIHAINFPGLPTIES
jgi:hypothetical protein